MPGGHCHYTIRWVRGERAAHTGDTKMGFSACSAKPSRRSAVALSCATPPPLSSSHDRGGKLARIASPPSSHISDPLCETHAASTTSHISRATLLVCNCRAARDFCPRRGQRLAMFPNRARRGRAWESRITHTLGRGRSAAGTPLSLRAPATLPLCGIWATQQRANPSRARGRLADSAAISAVGARREGCTHRQLQYWSARELQPVEALSLPSAKCSFLKRLQRQIFLTDFSKPLDQSICTKATLILVISSTN